MGVGDIFAREFLKAGRIRVLLGAVEFRAASAAHQVDHAIRLRPADTVELPVELPFSFDCSLVPLA